MTAVTVAEVEFFDSPALTTSMHSGWFAPEVERINASERNTRSS
jgi:hypothetical protein